MTRQPDDGGPAFPWMERVEDWTHRQAHEPPEVYYIVREGMTLRDWFAGQALAGRAICKVWVGDSEDPECADAAARWAYFFADAMLAARKGGAE